jgi:SAM-dependent methyltransferase
MVRSATVPRAGQSEAEVLDERARAWAARPLLREIYRRYFASMCAQLQRRGDDAGVIVELGGGSGNFRDYFRAQTAVRGRLITTDVVATPHVDLAADAMALPFEDASIDNLLMQDVLHHLPYPLRFFREAQRVLRPGGRIVMMEPYISPASRVVFKLAHPEPVDMRARIFPPGQEVGPDAEDPAAFTGTGAFASNQAIPTLLFYRDRPQFARRFPGLAILARQRRSCLVYPLSGGFSGPCLLPRWSWPLAWGVERCLAPLAGLMAFRLMVVVGKKG